MSKGWFGVALYEPKLEANIGMVLRSSHAFGAAFVALIGSRYMRRVAADTTDAQNQLPVLYFRDWPLFTESMREYVLVGVEVGKGMDVSRFHHPKQAIYVFGGEDRTLPAICPTYCHIQTRYCLNMAHATTVVMYARQAMGEEVG